MAEYRSNSPEHRVLQQAAKKRAIAAGWKAVGSTYVHTNGTKYLMRDMDGWIDLCGNEGIDLD